MHSAEGSTVQAVQAVNLTVYQGETYYDKLMLQIC